MAALSAQRTHNHLRLAPLGSKLKRGDFRKIDLNVYISSGLALLILRILSAAEPSLMPMPGSSTTPVFQAFALARPFV
jgi:hypothetical protein